MLLLHGPLSLWERGPVVYGRTVARDPHKAYLSSNACARMSPETHILHTRWFRRSVVTIAALASVWLLLLIPDPEFDLGRPVVAPVDRAPFVWGQDSVWFELERRFVLARDSDAAQLRVKVRRGLDTIEALLADDASSDRAPWDGSYRDIERRLFEVAPDVAGCPETFAAYLDVATRFRDHMKERSTTWPMNDETVRRTMYRSLYGVRAALEEVMLQLPPASVPALVIGRDRTGHGPSADLLGVEIRSGDILVSRGGAPTSALIARGNDYPGNFSHVALVHVDPVSGEVQIIESHIEIGVAIASVDDYLRDKKLRVMVMRLRDDHPSVLADPSIAHRAAERALQDARTRRIPYDFEMRYDDPSKLFCSEVASAAYATVGIRLWTGLSTISTPGLRSWLGAFGVRYFETQEPSDLEYDPQLVVVAEWRDPETLYQDHLDNAVTEAMLEGAERGEPLRHAWWLLPAARAMKAYSLALNVVGEAGPVPEGMSATAALRNRWYSGRHASARAIVMTKADAFRAANGYRPPYWRLLEMARAALAELDR